MILANLRSFSPKTVFETKFVLSFVCAGESFRQQAYLLGCPVTLV